jgi:isopropylmalate/homocitrate/citramalate synthase
MTLPQKVKVVEVGPRDGLQNEPDLVPPEVIIELIERLAAAGLPVVEVGAFVSPKWVPQMADSDRVLAGLRRQPGVAYPVLVPNGRGLEAALAASAQEIAIFGAASETFSQKNINCSIAQSLARFAPVAETARARGLTICPACWAALTRVRSSRLGWRKWLSLCGVWAAMRFRSAIPSGSAPPPRPGPWSRL